MLKKMKTVGEIYETGDYSVFKRMVWNRSVTNARKEKIKHSIKKYGYIMSPICVNEEMAVIDGQGRLDALTELGMPVHYYIVPGAGRDECIAMNANGTQWTVQDYIESYANSGVEDYRRFVALQREFAGNGICFQAFLFSIRNSTVDNTTIKDGHLRVSKDEYDGARVKLSILKKYMPYMKHVQGSRAYAEIALLFIFGCENLNEENLFARVQTNIRTLAPVSTIVSGCKAFSDLYNYNRKKDKVYWDVDYDKYLHDNLPSYCRRWGVDSKYRRNKENELMNMSP